MLKDLIYYFNQIVWGNGLVPSSTRPSFEPKLIQISRRSVTLPQRVKYATAQYLEQFRSCNIVRDNLVRSLPQINDNLSISWKYDINASCQSNSRGGGLQRGLFIAMDLKQKNPVNSPHKGQWRGAVMFSLICVWINGRVNNREAGDLRRYRAHCEVIVMWN